MNLRAAVILLLVLTALTGCRSKPSIAKKAIDEYAVAVKHFEAGRLDEAMAAANRAVAADPNTVLARWLLASIYLKQGDLPSAIFEMQKVVERAPDKPEAVLAGNRIGEILVKAGAREEARKWFESCNQLLPDYEPSLINLGVMDLEDGWLERSEERLGHAVEIAPRHANAHVQYARVLDALDRNEEARAQLRMALDCPDLDDEVREQIVTYLGE